MRRVCQVYIELLVISSLFGLSGCGGGAGTPSFQPRARPAAVHVFVLVEENHSYSQVIGNAAMPYTNSLAQKYALATQYYGNRHNSLPNYFMLTVGDLVTTDDLYTGTVTANNVVRALTKAGKTWKVYAESLPSIGYLGAAPAPYARDHNPFTYFSDVKSSSSQAANVVPITQLASDLKNGTLPDYAMIVPNLDNDGHDCPNSASYCTDTQKLAAIDSWVQTNVGPLINSSAFTNSLLIYTWDESNINDFTHQGGQVATILIGSKVKAGYKSKAFYQHESALKLSMQLLGLNDYPGAAATAPDMAEFF
jgi:phosphatidylinositol-3-phosphatase